jgi:hypothetical protein
VTPQFNVPCLQAQSTHDLLMVNILIVSDGKKNNKKCIGFLHRRMIAVFSSKSLTLCAKFVKRTGKFSTMSCHCLMNTAETQSCRVVNIIYMLYFFGFIHIPIKKCFLFSRLCVFTLFVSYKVEYQPKKTIKKISADLSDQFFCKIYYMH